MLYMYVISNLHHDVLWPKPESQPAHRDMPFSYSQTLRPAKQPQKPFWEGVSCNKRRVILYVFSMWPYIYSSLLSTAWNRVFEYDCYQERHDHVQGHEGIEYKVKLQDITNSWISGKEARQKRSWNQVVVVTHLFVSSMGWSIGSCSIGN